ncbi:hypothetical protein A0H81_08115 [Grifola frondosa]|uniref:WW domain-containing protein n=1 Tax=Grifola frondosa TaxID=5627 RepID=A0A1C7MA10_GRIFR|nr:hypothetical protein A0H81_08115 [Grifola frondosa]
MSQPPPYGPSGGRPSNPDKRPLPPGWIEQYDSSYNAWFYVNTMEQPPRSSWVHPLGPPNSPQPPSAYAPPSGPPPPDNRGYSPYPPSGGYNSQPNYQPSPPPQQYGGGYGGYNGPPQGGYQGGYQSGPPPEQRGWFGGSSQPQQPVLVQESKPKKSGMGMGTAIAAGGVGLLGGALLAEAWESHDDHEREIGYDQGFQNGDQVGYQDGYDNGFDNGDNGMDDGGGW